MLLMSGEVCYDLLVKGIRWRIGSGTRVKVFQDPWRLRPHSFKPITVPSPDHLHLLVQDLLHESGEWDWTKVNNFLWEVDRLEVNRIPIGPDFGDDKLIWHYNSKCVYTVRSGYYLATKIDESGSNGLNCGFSIGLRKLWNLKLPNKIKIHIWLLLFEAIPVRENLILRGVAIHEKCPSCNSYPEDIPHTFWYCSFARKVWKNSELWPRLIGFQGGGFGDLFQWLVDNEHGEDFSNFALICWSLWTERNLLVFQNKVEDWADVLTRARRTKEQYRIFSTNQIDVGIQPSTQSFWQPPTTDAFKVNVDTAVTQSLNHFGVGIVRRDNNGYLLFVEGWNFQGALCVRTAELFAIREGLNKVISMRWSRVIIETENKLLSLPMNQ